MKCPHCYKRMKVDGKVDETWRFYACKWCGYKSAKHIHPSPKKGIKA